MDCWTLCGGNRNEFWGFGLGFGSIFGGMFVLGLPLMLLVQIFSHFTNQAKSKHYNAWHQTPVLAAKLDTHLMSFILRQFS